MSSNIVLPYYTTTGKNGSWLTQLAQKWKEVSKVSGKINTVVHFLQAWTICGPYVGKIIPSPIQFLHTTSNSTTPEVCSKNFGLYCFFDQFFLSNLNLVKFVQNLEKPKFRAGQKWKKFLATSAVKLTKVECSIGRQKYAKWTPVA